MEAGLKGIRAFTNNSSCIINGGFSWFRLCMLLIEQSFFFFFSHNVMLFLLLTKTWTVQWFEQTWFCVRGSGGEIADAHKTSWKKKKKKKFQKRFIGKIHENPFQPSQSSWCVLWWLYKAMWEVLCQCVLNLLSICYLTGSCSVTIDQICLMRAMPLSWQGY